MLNKSFFKYLFILVPLFCSTIVINNLYAAAMAEDPHPAEEGADFFSPGKKRAVSTGKQLIDMRGLLKEIFGEGIEEEHGILFEESPRTEDPDFRSSLFRLKRKLEKRLGEGGQVITAFAEITLIRNELEGIPEDRLEHCATEYFGRMEGFEGIEFRAKPDGDQLGAKAVVTLSGSPSIFYVKTHSLGHRSISRSSGAHSLNPIELMVYAVLEQLGDSPKVHFFGRDDKTAFIATEDAGEKGAEFNTYEHSLKDDGRKEALWGSEAYRYIKDTPYAERDRDTLMDIIEGNPQSRSLADQFTRMDIISRIFRLSDLIGNPGNFGFALQPDGTIQHAIIDFRIIPDEEGAYSISEGNLIGFYKGNGIFSPLSADSFLCHVLKDRTPAIRAERALPHVTEIQERLEEVGTAAIERVMAFVESVSAKTDGPEKFITQSHRTLMEYKEAVLHNAEMFLKYLSDGAPEIA